MPKTIIFSWINFLFAGIVYVMMHAAHTEIRCCVGKRFPRSYFPILCLPWICQVYDRGFVWTSIRFFVAWLSELCLALVTCV